MHAKPFWVAAAGLLLVAGLRAAAGEPGLSPAALAAAIHVLQTGDAVDCLRETGRLGDSGASALPALFYAITNRDAMVRCTAWRSIDRAGLPVDARVTQQLLQRLGDVPDPQEFRHALELVHPVLQGLLQAEPASESVRLQLGTVCYGLAETSPGQPAPPLLARAAELAGSLYREQGPYAAEHAGFLFARAEESIGGACFRENKLPAAAAYETARAVWSDFMTGSSTNRICVARFLVLSCKVADCYWYAGRTVEAVSNYQAAEAMLASTTNRDEAWWEPAAMLIAAYERRSSQSLMDANYFAAERLLARARALADARVADTPTCRFGISWTYALGVRTADLCVLADHADQAETFLARAESVLLTPGARAVYDLRERSLRLQLLRRFRTALARLQASRPWRGQDCRVVAPVFHELGEIALEMGRPRVAYAYSRDALLLSLCLAPKGTRSDPSGQLVEMENMALISEALAKTGEAMTLASNALAQANGMLEKSGRSDRDALQGRVRVLSMLARLNAAAGAAELAKQYQTDTLAAVEECKRGGAWADDQANVFRQDDPVQIPQEPWSAGAAAGGRDELERLIYSHWENGFWLQAAPPRNGGALRQP